MMSELLIHFKGNHIRILVFLDRKKEKKLQEFYMIIKKEKESWKESTFLYNFEFLI